MTTAEQIEQIDEFFSLLEDEDVDFVGVNSHPDVPALTYRWSRNEAVECCPLDVLLQAGRESMERLGMRRIVSRGNHLRGDTYTGQRVKMTVFKSGRRSQYMLMTAGMPGSREKCKEVTREISALIEQVAEEACAG